MISKEHIEKVIKNNRAGIAAHQLFKEFELEFKTLDRIAYLSYHRFCCNLSQIEMEELARLTIEWKKAFDAQKQTNP